MLLVVVGAGASYDSIPTRPVGGNPFDYRPPLADQLFESRPTFEAVQRLLPRVMEIVPNLFRRPNGESVEDVLARFADEASWYSDRLTHLACVRFYIQSIIHECEVGWYRNKPVASNMMALIDQMESVRRSGRRAFFVTFNYDRLIEHALSVRGQSFETLHDYIPNDGYNVFKLHGSVDWLRPIPGRPITAFGGPVWEIAQNVSSQIADLPKPGDIAKTQAVPAVGHDGVAAIPAIAIPLKAKSEFELPQAHRNVLTICLGEARQILTIGWRGAEGHFLDLLHTHNRSAFKVYCVAGSIADAEQTQANMQSAGIEGEYKLFGDGFTSFIANNAGLPLFRVASSAK
jgi:hypothetical protein